MQTCYRILFGFVMMVGLDLKTRGENLVFQSSENRVALLELFTSEGCSSCPPAETWLSGLRSSAGLWKEFVPVAFHVDYWDYLGWRDPWASAGFSDRQRAYAALWHSDSTYTPGFVLNGKEWRPLLRPKDGPRSSRSKSGCLIISSADRKHLLSWRRKPPCMIPIEPFGSRRGARSAGTYFILSKDFWRICQSFSPLNFSRAALFTPASLAFFVGFETL